MPAPKSWSPDVREQVKKKVLHMRSKMKLWKTSKKSLDPLSLLEDKSLVGVEIIYRQGTNQEVTGTVKNLRWFKSTEAVYADIRINKFQTETNVALSDETFSLTEEGIKTVNNRRKKEEEKVDVSMKVDVVKDNGNSVSVVPVDLDDNKVWMNDEGINGWVRFFQNLCIEHKASAFPTDSFFDAGLVSRDIQAQLAAKGMQGCQKMLLPYHDSDHWMLLEVSVGGDPKTATVIVFDSVARKDDNLSKSPDPLSAKVNMWPFSLLHF
jgi:hypothetical protein